MSPREVLSGEQCSLPSFPFTILLVWAQVSLQPSGEWDRGTDSSCNYASFIPYLCYVNANLNHSQPWLFPPNTCKRWADEALSTFHEAREDVPPAGLKRWLITWNSHHANKGYVSLAAFLIPREPKLERLLQFTQLLAEVQIWTVLTLLFNHCL